MEHGDVPRIWVVYLVASLLLLYISQTSYASQISASSNNAFTLSNLTIDVGQTSFANTVISGGAGLYSGQWTWMNSNQIENQVINTINVGGSNSNPEAIAFNPQGTLAYVGMSPASDGSINIINVASNALVNSIGVPDFISGEGIVFNPSGTLAYVAVENKYVGIVTVATNTVTTQVSLGSLGPSSVAINPSGSLLYSPECCVSTSNFKVISTASNSIVNSLTISSVGAFAYEVAFNPQGSLAYVGYGDSLTAINVINVASNTVVNSIVVGPNPGAMAFNPSGTLAYVTLSGVSRSAINVINVAANAVVNTIPTSSSSGAIAINPSGTLAYASSGDNIAMINLQTNAIVNTIGIGHQIGSIAINPLGSFVYETNIGSGSGTGTVETIGTLPNSQLQNLPSGGQLQLSINAISSNSISFSFNGVQYSVSTGTNTIYGTWNLYGFAQDNGTNIYYYGSNTILLANTITIDPALVAGNPTSSNSLAVAANPSGGTPPYSYQWYSGSSPTCTSDAAITGATLPYYSPLSTISTYYCYQVTDSATTPASQYSNAISFAPQPMTLSNTVIDIGQSTVANVIVSGGSGGPYSGQWTWLSANQTGNAISNTIFSGGSPQEIAINPQGTLAYVSSSTTVNVINLATNTVVNTLTNSFFDALGIAFNPSGTLAYVVNSGSNNVNVINVATNSIVNTINVGSDPGGIAINPSGTLAYVTNFNTGTVSVINLATNTVVNTIYSGVNPNYLAFNPSGTLAYIGNSNGANVNVINVASNSVVNTIHIGAAVECISINPQGTLAYVAYNNGIAAINLATNTVMTTISVGPSPYCVAFNPSGTLAYVTGVGVRGVLNVINVATNTVVNTIGIGTDLGTVTFNPSGTLAYVGGSGNGNIYVVSNITETAIQPLSPTTNAMQLTINALNSNTLTFNFNGATYDQSTGTNTVYGKWSLYGFAQDNGIKLYYYGSNSLLMSNTITIDPALVAGTPSSVGLSDGQIFGLAANPSGGAPPYSYQWYSGSSSTCTSDTAIPGATSSTYSGSTSSPTYYCYQATDSASTPVSQLSNTLLVSSGPTISRLVIAVGQTSTANAIITGGSGGPYSGEWTWISNNPANQITNFKVINTIASGNKPRGVAFNLQGTLAYVAEGNGDTINVINVAKNLTVNTIPAGFPIDIAVAPSGTFAYVSEIAGSGSVNVLNLAMNQTVSSITSGMDSPFGITFNPRGTLAYVGQDGGTTVSVISTASNAVVNTITGGRNPIAVAFNPSGTLAYVSESGISSGSSTVNVINVAQNLTVNTLTGHIGPWGIKVNPQGTLVYVAEFGLSGRNVNVINVAQNDTVNSISSGSSPLGVAFNPSGSLAFVAEETGRTVNVINVAQNKTIGFAWLGSGPYWVAVNPQGTLVYATQLSGTAVNIIGDLPETALQELPYQGSNALLSLSVNAVSSNSIIFTFNGIGYTESTGSNTVYGVWNLYGFAQDNGTNLYYYGSNTVQFSNTITIVPFPTVALSVSNSTANKGQNITLTASVNGGEGPFNVAFYNVSNGTQLGSNRVIPSPGGSNVISFTVGSSTSFNAVITDTGTSLPITINSSTVSISINGHNPANVCSGNSCSTGAGQQTTTSLATSTVATTTTAQNYTGSNSTSHIDVTLTNKTPAIVYANQSGVSLTIGNAGSGSLDVGVTISNLTQRQFAPPANYTKVRVVNVTVSNQNVSVTATLKYPCGISSDSIKPFIFDNGNGTWVPISPYTVNTFSCSVTFAIPSDPVVALMQQTTFNTTTATTTSTVATTMPTTVQEIQSGSNSNALYLATAVVIVILAAAAYFLKFRRRSPRLGSSS